MWLCLCEVGRQGEGFDVVSSLVQVPVDTFNDDLLRAVGAASRAIHARHRPQFRCFLRSVGRRPGLQIIDTGGRLVQG
jgi:hypothetical protein